MKTIIGIKVNGIRGIRNMNLKISNIFILLQLLGLQAEIPSEQMKCLNAVIYVFCFDYFQYLISCKGNRHYYKAWIISAGEQFKIV